MWVLTLILDSFLVIFPVMCILVWRSGKSLTGKQPENQRAQLLRGIKQSSPILLLIVVNTMHQIVDLHFPSPSREKSFWQGFIIASDLFFVGFSLNNFVCLMYEEREKRRLAQANKNASRI